VHKRVIDELDRVQVTEIVEQAAERLPRIPAKYLLPLVDADNRRHTQALADDLHQWRETGWSNQRHRHAMTSISRRGETILFEAIMSSKYREPKKEGSEESRAFSPAQEPGATMRYFGASLRILGGTALVATDLSLGLTAGLWSTILTVGATSVPTYVGVTGSVGTGLFQVADAMEKIGGIQKETVAAARERFKRRRAAVAGTRLPRSMEGARRGDC
jgi:hypothetical protein